MALWVKYNNLCILILIHSNPNCTLHLSLVKNLFTENPQAHVTTEVTVINFRIDKHALTLTAHLHLHALANGRSRPAQCL